MNPKQIVVIGAGIGGLTTAAELARSGHDVAVLEAHVYPGGSAGTFFHKGYRFDAGATLAGGFAAGMPLDIIGRRYGIDWQERSEPAAMLVHLGQEDVITRWNEPTAWRDERLQQFGAQTESFWRWQARTADLLWELANLQLPWPPQTPGDLGRDTMLGSQWLVGLAQRRELKRILPLLRDVFRNVGRHLPAHAERLRRFVDAQLLISAQTTSPHANALFAAAALDLSRTGVGHTPGGMGGIARKLAAAVKRLGGDIRYRQEVVRVQKQAGAGWLVETKRGLELTADEVVFNLPPINIARLLGADAPTALQRSATIPNDGWGAFMLYLGIDEAIVPKTPTLHHQLVAGDPSVPGNTLFLSFSPAWDADRAPDGRRALTMSTHTPLDDWWRLIDQDRNAYEHRKANMAERLLTTAESFFPGLREATDLILPGTPITFQRFTRRLHGWVGGYPQTNLFRTQGPRLGPGLWMVGDSIFPGQSVPAVALGGLRVAGQMLGENQSQSATQHFPILNQEILS